MIFAQILILMAFEMIDSNFQGESLLILLVTYQWLLVT